MITHAGRRLDDRVARERQAAGRRPAARANRRGGRRPPAAVRAAAGTRRASSCSWRIRRPRVGDRRRGVAAGPVPSGWTSGLVGRPAVIPSRERRAASAMGGRVLLEVRRALAQPCPRPRPRSPPALVASAVTASLPARGSPVAPAGCCEQRLRGRSASSRTPTLELERHRLAHEVEDRRCDILDPAKIVGTREAARAGERDHPGDPVATDVRA